MTIIVPGSAAALGSALFGSPDFRPGPGMTPSLDGFTFSTTNKGPNIVLSNGNKTAQGNGANYEIVQVVDPWGWPSSYGQVQIDSTAGPVHLSCAPSTYDFTTAGPGVPGLNIPGFSWRSNTGTFYGWIEDGDIHVSVFLGGYGVGDVISWQYSGAGPFFRADSGSSFPPGTSFSPYVCLNNTIVYYVCPALAAGGRMTLTI